MNYQMVNRAMAPLVAGNWSKSTGVCPEPGCGQEIEVMVDYRALAQMPALMSLEPLIICNDCADFRHALREAESIAYLVMQSYRKQALTINAESKNPEVMRPKLDELNANFRQVVDGVVRRILGILSQRTGKPVLDVPGWSGQMLGSQWHIESKYGGEKLLKVNPVDLTGSVIIAMRTSYGIVLKHHGKSKPVAPAAPAKRIMEVPEL